MKYIEGKEKVPDSGALHYLPYVCLLFANTFWALSYIHSNEYNINPIQTTLIRATCTFLFNYGFCKWRGYTLDLKQPNDFRAMIIRNMLVLVHSFTMAYSQFILPLPIVHTISCSGVLIIYVMDYLMYKISINCVQAVGIFIGFTGVILNVNGGLITKYIDPSYQLNTKFTNYVTEDPLKRSIFSIFMFVVMIGWAYSVISIKKLKNFNSLQFNYHMGLILVLGSGFAYPVLPSSVSVDRLCLGLLFTGLPLAFSQFLFTGGLTMSKETGTLTMMNFITVAIGYLLSIFRYNETPNFLSIFGMILVAIGVYISIFYKEKPVSVE